MLSNGKGFYSTLAYTRGCRRLGIGFLSPDVNVARPGFVPEGDSICVPLYRIKGLTTATLGRCQVEKARGSFGSLRDFHDRVGVGLVEMLNLIRVGAFDGFGEPRTAQFWQLHHIAQWPHAQGLLFKSDEKTALPEIPLTEPSGEQRLSDGMELLGFTVTGHPLDQFPGIAWDTYCPISEVSRHAG